MAETTTPPQDKLKVLFAEDEINSGKMLKIILERAGYDVTVVHDGLSAFDSALSLLPDIILLDIFMPRMDGREVLRKLKAMPITSEIPVILITAYGNAETVVEAFKLGAEDYIHKPFLPQELLARIQVVEKVHKLDVTRREKVPSESPIFMSYCRSDWERFVYPLVCSLEEEGLPIWVDQKFIEGSSDWLDEINNALKLARSLIVCVSPEAIESRYVKMEYRYAFNNRKPIYPIICREAELPAELQILQYYTYTETDKLIFALKRNASASL